MKFEVEYYDGDLGASLCKVIKGERRLANNIAKTLAKDTGRCAKVRPLRSGWTLYAVHLSTGRIYRVQGGLDKRDTERAWRRWDGRQLNTVAIPWPDWAPAADLPGAIEAIAGI